MSPDDSHAAGPRADCSRDPESGLLERVREWNDVFPWLKLIRTLRLAGSPPLVGLTFLCLGLWWAGAVFLLGDVVRTDSGIANGSVGIGSRPMQAVTRLAFLTSPSAVYHLPSQANGWRLLLGTAWSLLIWTPVGLLLIRQGALLAVGRPMMGLLTGLRFACSRMPRAWLTAIVPMICVATIALPIFVIGKLAKPIEGIAAVEITVALVVALIAIAGGLLAFGAHVAIPLGWAALANEQNPDPLDSLSRGYEYLLRRPLHLAWYVVLSLVMILVIGALASGVASAAGDVAAAALVGSGVAELQVIRVMVVLSWFPVAVVVALSWGLVGGVYLLLRCDAGGQEMEDLWVPSPEPQPPLPSLPRS